MEYNPEIVEHQKKMMTYGSLFWLAINGGLAYFIGKNYWKKSGWGKFGTLWFGTSAAANAATAMGVMATPTELIKKAMSNENNKQDSNFVGPMPPQK